MSTSYPINNPWEDTALRWMRAASRFHARMHGARDADDEEQPTESRSGSRRRPTWADRAGWPADWADWCDDPREAGRQFTGSSEAGGRGRGHRGRGPGPRGRAYGPGFGPGSGPGSWAGGPGPWGSGSGFGLGFGPGFGHRGRRRGRGNVRAAVLALLAEEPRHGYSIMTELAERSGGLWRPSPGSVYPVLQQLQDEGLVTSQDSDGRRVFSLTDEGRAYVRANADDLSEPWKIAETGPQRRGRSLLEGLGGLGAATFEVGRLGTEEQTTAARAILDEARRAMYRLLADDDESLDDEDATAPPYGRAPDSPGGRVQDSPGGQVQDGPVGG